MIKVNRFNEKACRRQNPWKLPNGDRVHVFASTSAYLPLCSQGRLTAFVGPFPVRVVEWKLWCRVLNTFCRRPRHHFCRLDRYTSYKSHFSSFATSKSFRWRDLREKLCRDNEEMKPLMTRVTYRLNITHTSNQIRNTLLFLPLAIRLTWEDVACLLLWPASVFLLLFPPCLPYHPCLPFRQRACRKIRPFLPFHHHRRRDVRKYRACHRPVRLPADPVMNLDKFNLKWAPYIFIHKWCSWYTFQTSTCLQAYAIVKASFFWIWQNFISVGDFLKLVTGIWIFVWVQLLGKFPDK